MDSLEDTGIKSAVVEYIRACASRYGVQKVILFGSRARGDHSPKSDIDLAVSGGDQVRFSLDVEENAPTLLEFDIVNLDGSVSEELRTLVAKDGRLLYEEIR